MGLRGRDFIGSTLRETAAGLLSVALRVPHQGPAPQCGGIGRWRPAGHELQKHGRLSTVADRSWQLAVDARRRPICSGGTAASTITVTVGGIALTVLMALLVFTLVDRAAPGDGPGRRGHRRAARLGGAAAAAARRCPRSTRSSCSTSDGRVSSWSKQRRAAQGRTAAEEILGHEYSDVLHARRRRPPVGRRTVFAEAIERRLRPRSTASGSVRTAPASGRTARSPWSGTPDGSIRGFVEVVQDVTDRQRSEVKFRGLLEVAPDAILGVDIAGRIVIVNAKAEEVFGYAAGLPARPVRRACWCRRPGHLAGGPDMPMRPTIAGYEVVEPAARRRMSRSRRAGPTATSVPGRGQPEHAGHRGRRHHLGGHPRHQRAQGGRAGHPGPQPDVSNSASASGRRS